MTTAKPQTIRELREARNLTIQDVSRLAGVSDSELRRWEAGTAEIQAGKLPDLAKAFGIPLEGIQLERNRRHYRNGNLRLVLRTTGNLRKGFTTHLDLIVGASETNAALPDYNLKADGESREEALDSLAAKLDEVFASAHEN